MSAPPSLQNKTNSNCIAYRRYAAHNTFAADRFDRLCDDGIEQLPCQLGLHPHRRGRQCLLRHRLRTEAGRLFLSAVRPSL